ncbi:membrane-spanning 4-domains subfamily A member 8-like [Stegostoma tigrinum]|uniref:membrane-spanning 4-domains subfamily A member 8-like n=1 Tax=Stegostoma tigrinum TaxID=3053191 RepID=UPI0028704933|nr:membrane-spanning 4-domains subfamily A member 8-like [Stegostoma tigrinum]XP_059498796.1 membrane-spanning 4-domains subfamily A member 8-like [Stegostoma tigrinum]
MAAVNGFPADRAPVVTNIYPQPPLGAPSGGGHPRESFAPRPGAQAYERMLKGELKALGVTQIMVGIVCVMFGTPLLLSLLSMTTIIGTPWWSGLLFIVSGSMSVATERQPGRCLVGGCLASNTVSAVAAAIAGFLFFTDLFVEPCTHTHLCLQLRGMLEVSTSLKVLLLMFDVLELVLSLTVASFSCRGLHCRFEDSTVPAAVVIHTIMHPSALPVSYPSSHSAVNPSYNPTFPLNEKIV